MGFDNDITDLMKNWPFDPDDYIRRVVGPDGRPKLQVRFPMGLEQYELDGRPDGLQPMGHESYLDYYIHLRDLTAAEGSSASSFHLSACDCESLRSEAEVFYYRCDLLYREKDYDRVIRDTQRNLLVFDLLTQCADHPEDAESLQRYQPVTLRLHFVSRAMVSLKQGRHEESLRQVREGIRRIESLPPIEERQWRRECKAAVAKLRRLARHIMRNKPLTARQRLQLDLKRAVAREDYESAARLRDKLATMTCQERGSQATS